MNTYIATGTIRDVATRYFFEQEIKAENILEASAKAKKMVADGTMPVRTPKITAPELDLNVRRQGFDLHTPLPE